MTAHQPVIRRVRFDERYRDLSFGWLGDPDMARRTDCGPITREQQLAWYAGLPARTDYAIWGIEYDGVPVGAMGIKRIGEGDGAEYFLYVGERAYWGCGIADWAFREIVAEGRDRGLRRIYGRVRRDNPRSLAAHLRNGFRLLREDDRYSWIGCVLDQVGVRRSA